MKSRPPFIAKAVALLSIATQAFAQPNTSQVITVPTPSETTRRQLHVEQRKFENYISDGENELRNAQYRYTLPQYALAENNVILALLNLDITFALMGGHPGRIGALKTSIFFNEQQQVRDFQWHYETLRTRAYDLQNQINYFIWYKLGPTGFTNAIAAYMRNWSDQIRNSPNPEARAQDVFRQIERAQQQQRGVTPGEINAAAGGAQAQNLGNGLSWDPATGTVRDSRGNVIPGAAWDPSKHLVTIGPYSFDPRNPNVVVDQQGNPLPNVRFNPETGQFEQYDPNVHAWTPVSPSSLSGNHGSASTATPYSQQPVARSLGGGSNYSQTPAPTDNIMTADGRRLGWEEFRTYLDPTTGKVKPDVVRVKYADHQGGQITSETRFSVKLEKGSGPRDWVLDEKPVDTLDWQFLIRPVGDQQKLNQGFQATYELVNDSPSPSDFDVTGWEGPDGTVFPTPEKQFTVTFAQPEQQTIKVHGVTKKYNSKFAITLGTR